VQRVGVGADRGLDYGLDVQEVQAAVTLGGWLEGHDAEPVGGPPDASGDLAPIGDEETADGPSRFIWSWRCLLGHRGPWEGTSRFSGWRTKPAGRPERV
jgi:hypothetical protein